jgi:hypothetical protein
MATAALVGVAALAARTGSYATTGSNTFDGGAYFSSSFNPTGFTTTASLYTDGGLRVGRDAYISGTLYLNNVTVYGTQSVAYISSSQLNIGTNLITVNTDTPSIRFGGLSVYDSGSTGLTGSILWDSQNNHWIYSNPSGSSYSGGMFISGPRTSTLGSETGTTSCMLLAGQGGDHLTSSMIYHDSTVTCIGTGASITSAGAACFASSVCVAGEMAVRGNSSAYNTHYFTTGASNVAKYIQYNAAGTAINQIAADAHSYFNSGCNVGIGINAPTLKLDVRGTLGIPATTGTSQYGYLRLTSNAGSSRTLDFGGYDSGRNYAMWMQATDWADLSVNAPLILNPNGGNIGIGTCAPCATTHVNSGGNYIWSTGNGYGDFYVGNGTYGLSIGTAIGGGGAGDTRLWTKGGTHTFYIGTSNVDALKIDSSQNICVAGNIYGCSSVLANNNIRISTSTSAGNATDPAITTGGCTKVGVYFAGGCVGFGTSGNMLILTPTGRVGIGTETPNYGNLSIVCTDNTILSSALWGTSTAAGVTAAIYNGSQCANSVAGLRLITRDSGASIWNIYNVSTGPSAGDLAFGNGNSGTGSEKLRITNDGITCFACTVCAPAFVGGTLSGTTIYGSTAVCSPVGKFTSCIDAGSGTFSGALGGTSATLSGLLTITSGAGTKAVWATTRNFGVNRNFQIAVDEFAESAFTITPSTTLGGSGYTTPIFTLAAAGAATFSSTITGTTIYGSTPVCSPVGKFTSCIDAGTGYFSGNVNVTVANTPEVLLTHSNTSKTFLMAVDGSNAFFRANSTNNILFQYAGGTTALNINGSTGVACFSSTVCVGNSLIVGSTSTFGSDMFTYLNGGIFFSGGGSYNAGIFGRNGGCDLILQSGGLQRLVVTSTGIACFACQICAPAAIFTGCVGIGITSPTTKLDVYAGVCTSEIIWGQTIRNEGNAATTGYGIGLKFKISGDSVPNELYKWAGITAVAGTDYSNRTDLAFYTNAASVAHATEKVRITGDGNVGVGISPFNKMTINTGTGNNLDIFDTGASFGIGMQAVNGNNTAYKSFDFYASKYSFFAGQAIFSCTVCAPTAIFTGCVGIGQTSPSFGLEVFSSAQTAVTSNNTFGANFNIIFNRDNTGGTRNCFNFLADQNSGYIRTLNNYPINFVTNGQNRLLLSSTGEACFACRPSFPGANLICSYTCTYSSYTAGCWLGLFAGDNGYNGAYAFTVVGQFTLSGTTLYSMNYSTVPYIHSSTSLGSTNGNDFYALPHTSAGHADNGTLVCFRRARYSGNTPAGNRTEFCMNATYNTSFTATTYVLAWV